jgi:threonine dehydratase
LAATIVIPERAPYDRVRTISRLGGHVTLHGEDSHAAADEAKRLAAQGGLTYIPPFDDPYVIAGQGTIGVELLRQTNAAKLEAVFCCVGGGGLIAGIGVYVKRITPSVKIIGVQTHDSDAMTRSLQAQRHVTLDSAGSFTGDASVRRVGDETFRICREVVDDMILVTTDEVCAAIRDIFEDTRSVVEPAGALALAGLKKYVRKYPSADPRRGLVAVVSGANIDFDSLGFIKERASLGDEGLVSVAMPNRPGAVAKLASAVHPTTVRGLSYRATQGDTASAMLTIAMDARSRGQDLVSLLQRLKDGDMVGTDLTHNELAKSHVRQMVGGRSSAAGERVFMFEFPERQGAFNELLRLIVSDFDISLLHYTGSNGDMGRVVVGFQCHGEDQKMMDFVQNLGYTWQEETENPAYVEFMRE